MNWQALTAVVLWCALMLCQAAPDVELEGSATMGGARSATKSDLPPLKVVNASLWWYAPIISNSGYGHEAVEYLGDLEKRREAHNGILRSSSDIKNDNQGLSIQIAAVGCSHHGDEVVIAALEGHEPELRSRLSRMLRLRRGRHPNARANDPSIVICHSEPGAWWTPTPMYDTVECPTSWATVAVGRTMFETDRIPSGWPRRLQYMREIWVPTEFHRSTFASSGVPHDKLFVIPESIDSQDRWNPLHHKPNFFATHHMAKAGSRCTFKFLSVFKWEERKGWDVLLSAFFEAFIADPPTKGDDEEKGLVCLFLKTSAYHSDVDDGDDDEYDFQVSEFLHRRYKKEMRWLKKQDRNRWLQIHIISSIVPADEFPSLYRSVDCVVQPSRGEGWGRPHMEAMAMGVPVIATNWSGNTAFMTDENSLLLRVDHLKEINSGPFAGHFWAEPSKEHLKELMKRAVWMKQQDGKLRLLGAKARHNVVTLFDNSIVTQLIVDRAIALLSEEWHLLHHHRPASASPRLQQISDDGTTPGDVKDFTFFNEDLEDDDL